MWNIVVIDDADDINSAIVITCLNFIIECIKRMHNEFEWVTMHPMQWNSLKAVHAINIKYTKEMFYVELHSTRQIFWFWFLIYFYFLFSLLTNQILIAK